MRFAPTSTPDDLERTVHAARQFKLGHNVSMEAMGTLILWFGWFGFNCGSTLAAAGAMELASKVAVNTTLAAASGGIIVACLEKYVAGDWVVPAICNGVLAALVSITVMSVRTVDCSEFPFDLNRFEIVHGHMYMATNHFPFRLLVRW